MERFHVQKWNIRDKEYTMIILLEEDIINKTYNLKGAGYEILVIPSKYKNTNNDYLNNIIEMALVRRGKIIYV